MQSSMSLLLGTSGWSYKEWVGPFYATPRRMFSTYAEVFQTTEINSTFYSYPTQSLVRGLYRTSPPGFVFAAKLPQLITHRKKLGIGEGVLEDLDRFMQLIRPLGEKLGPVLIQLPPSFNFEDDSEAFETFIESLPENMDFSAEFRHPSWIRDETWKMLRQNKVAYTIVDEPLLPAEMQVTSDIAYVRWHGHGRPTWYNYSYSKDQLAQWVPRLKEVTKKAKTTYGYFNNHFYWQLRRTDEKWGYPGAVKNGVELLEMLNQATQAQKEALKGISEWIEKKEGRGDRPTQRRLDNLNS